MRIAARSLVVVLLLGMVNVQPAPAADGSKTARPPAPSQVTPLYNGSFESSGGAYFAGWGTYNLGSGVWSSQTGTTPPSGFGCGSGITVPVPSDGSRAAMTIESSPGTHILYQDVLLLPGLNLVSFDLFVKNLGPAFANTGMLDHTGAQNQHFRADILSPIVAITDTGSGVIRNLYLTKPGDPTTTGTYIRVTGTAAAPANDPHVRIRFADTTNVTCLFSAVDNVKITRIVSGDTNADFKSDVFWRNAVTGQNVLWMMNGGSSPSAQVTNAVPDIHYKVAGIGDLDGNGTADVVWRHDLTGQVIAWRMNGAVPSGAVVGGVIDTNWRIEAVADVDGDAKADLVWRNITSGDVVVWFMNGATIRSAASIGRAANLNWHIVGAGDLNGDGNLDLIWNNDLTHANAVWFMNGATFTAATLDTIADPNWIFVAALSDPITGKANLAWRNTSTGQVVLWPMDGAKRISALSVGAVSGPAWHVEAVGDFNGDFFTDLFWRNSGTGETAVWLMYETNIYQAVTLTTVGDLNWSAAGPR